MARHHFRSGAVVTIKSAAEIRTTLKHGALEGALFMDEMYRYCDRTYRVFERGASGRGPSRRHCSRRLREALHDFLERSVARARALWREAWLEPFEEAAPVSVMEPPPHSGVSVMELPPHSGVAYKGPLSSLEDDVRVATAAANAQAAPLRPSLRVMKPRNSSI